MRIKPTLRQLVFAAAILAIGCSAEIPEPAITETRRGAFPNLIDHHGTPEATEDWSVMPFADQGAWFGFSLPTADDEELGVGFGGPFLMTDGRWVGKQLAGLSLPNAELIRTEGIPGALVSEWRVGAIEIGQHLWFDSARVALIRTEIRNRGAEVWIWEPRWVGEVFDETDVVEISDGAVVVRSSGGDRVRMTVGGGRDAIDLGDQRVELRPAEAISVKPGASTTLVLAISMVPAGDPEPEIDAPLATAEQSLARNRARWNGYISATEEAGPPGDAARIVAVKAVQTLIGNWRGPAGRFTHGGLFPSSNVWYFNGFWAWDSWKHAVALARFDPSIAADQLRLMAAQQDESGMVADVVYLDPAEDNWRDTKPPLLGWALEEVFNTTGDLELVRELYPGLVRYHEFWYRHRDHDGDGLCEYGSTDGTLEAARWESGMDNAVRFDSTGMLQNGDRAWSMDQESVDLNSYLYREKLALRDLADALGATGDVERWTAEAATLRDRIRATMFDEATGWFYDTAIDTGEIIPVRGPEGWIPLWAGVSGEEQAARVRTIMLDPEVFRTHVPFPTVAADHPEFSDGYWRGLVWLDQVFFAIEGLRAYGYTDDADRLTAQVLANLRGASVAGVPLRENYHPLTGEGRNVRHFSWTAAHLLLLTTGSR